jgi:CBS domain-containing protein
VANYHLCAKDIMQVEIATILDNMTVTEAAEQMRFEGVRSLIVEPHGEGDSYGIIAYADIVGKVLAKGLDPKAVYVHEVMTKPVITVNPDMPAQHIARLFGQHGFGHAPVVDCGKLLGVVSMTDLVTELLTEPK